jgi:hypothetical protein
MGRKAQQGGRPYFADSMDGWSGVLCENYAAAEFDAFRD